jgi:hypothetical protein
MLLQLSLGPLHLPVLIQVKSAESLRTIRTDRKIRCVGQPTHLISFWKPSAIRRYSFSPTDAANSANTNHGTERGTQVPVSTHQAGNSRFSYTGCRNRHGQDQRKGAEDAQLHPHRLIVGYRRKLPPHSQLSAPPFWYSITRVSKKFFSFLRSIASDIHGNGFSVSSNTRDNPSCAQRRLAIKCM